MGKNQRISLVACNCILIFFFINNFHFFFLQVKKISPINKGGVSFFQYEVQFFIELTQSFINDSDKIKPFKEFKDQFSKIKQKKLSNAIKIAEKICDGEFSFKQHISFVKEGLKLFEEQYKKIQDVKKDKIEKEKIEKKKKKLKKRK